MAAGSTSDFEQIIAGGMLVFLDQQVKFCCFFLVVLERVDLVVEFCRTIVQLAMLREVACGRYGLGRLPMGAAAEPSRPLELSIRS